MICSSVPQAIRSIARQFGPKPLYVDIMAGVEVNWVEYKNHAWAAAAGLIDAGVMPGDGIALIGFDGVEGMEFETGCQAAGAVSFMLPADLDENDVVNALLISRCSRYLLCDSDAAFAEAMRRALDPLSTVIAEIPAGQLRNPRFDVPVVPEDEQDNGNVEARLKMLGPEIPAAGFLHTMPDGRVMVVTLSHSNLQAMAATVATELMADENDVWTCLSPVSGTFGRVACWNAAMLSGGVFSTAPAGRKPVEALFLVQPSFAVCDRETAAAIDSGILDELELLEGARGRITRWGFRHACRRTFAGRDPHGMTDSLADLAVERLVRDIPGGRLRAIIFDGADLAAESRCNLRTAGIDLWAVLAPASVSCFMSVIRGGSIREGSVGRPLPGTIVRSTPHGGLMVESPLVMAGEMGQPGESSPDLDGRTLKSGFRGNVDDEGFVYIDAGAQ